MRRMLKCAIALVFPAALIACAPTGQLVVTADHLCRDWQHQTISKADKLTEPTAAQIEALNKSRPNWGCTYGENRAAKAS